MLNESTLNVRIKNKRDTAANWGARNPVILDGEIIIVETSDGYTRMKVGDGTSTYGELPFTDENLTAEILEIKTSSSEKVSGPISSTNKNVAVFSGTSGKLIQDSGYTIESNVPPNAIFTDTTYTAGNGLTLVGNVFSNTGVRAVTTGSTSGTINVNTNGNTQSVPVAGLGTSAYIDYEEFMNVSADQTVAGTKSFIGNVTTQGLFSNAVDLGSGKAIDVSLASCFYKTITGSTIFSITGVPTGMAACFTLILTNAGSYSIGFPTKVKWANKEQPEYTKNGVDVITFITLNGGNTWYGCASVLNAL